VIPIGHKTALLEYLESELGVDPEHTFEILNSATEFILYQAMFSGPVATPLGVVAVDPAGLSIVKQSEVLARYLRGGLTKDNAIMVIRQLLEID